jgi:hypothetical protein
VLLDLRQRLQAEYGKGPGAILLIDRAVGAYHDFVRVTGWIGNLSIHIEHEFFGRDGPGAHMADCTLEPFGYTCGASGARPQLHAKAARRIVYATRNAVTHSTRPDGVGRSMPCSTDGCGRAAGRSARSAHGSSRRRTRQEHHPAASPVRIEERAQQLDCGYTCNRMVLMYSRSCGLRASRHRS